MTKSPSYNNQYNFDEETVQIFLDASWKESSSWLSGVASSRGNCINSWIKKEDSYSASHVEACALLLMEKKAVFFTDSQDTTYAVRKHHPAPRFSGSIAVEFLYNASSLVNWDVVWISRVQNSSSHSM